MGSFEPIDGLPAWMRHMERRLRTLENARGRGRSLATADTPGTPPSMVVTTGEGMIKATWNGVLTDEDATPSNFVGMDVYAVPVGEPLEPDPEYHIGAILRPSGGSVTAPVMGGDYEVFAVTRTTKSEGHPGPAVAVTVDPLIDEGDLEDAIANIDVGGVEYGPNEPEDPTEGTLWFEGPLPDGPFVPKRYDEGIGAWRPATLDGDNAIDELSVGKLRTGTLDAIVTVSGVIRTNDLLYTPRFEIDDNGFWYGRYAGVGGGEPYRSSTFLQGTADGILARGTLEATNEAGTSGVRIRPLDSSVLRSKGVIEFVDGGDVVSTIRYIGPAGTSLLPALDIQGPQFSRTSPANIRLGGKSASIPYMSISSLEGELKGEFWDIGTDESGKTRIIHNLAQHDDGISLISLDSTQNVQDVKIRSGGSDGSRSPVQGQVMVNAGWREGTSTYAATSRIDLRARNIYLNGGDVMGAWTTYTPTLTATGTNPSGSYSLTGRWKRIGRTVFIYIEFNANSGFNSGSGAWIWSLPVPARSTGSDRAQLITAHVIAGGEWTGVGKLEGGSQIARTYAANMLLNSGFNGTGIVSGNRVMLQGSYEAASD